MGTVYILASKRNGTLYTGVTSDLFRRIYEHKNGLHDGFTKKYKINNLVRYQEYVSITEAIEYEKKIKGKKRSYKIELIEAENLHRIDLATKRYD